MGSDAGSVGPGPTAMETLQDEEVVGVCQFDRAARIVHVDDAFVDAIGRAPGAVVGSYASGVFRGRDDRDVDATVRAVGEDATATDPLAVTVERADHDDPLRCALDLRPLAESDGATIGVVRDVSVRLERRRERERFEVLFEESTDVNAVIDPDGTFQYVTPSVEAVLGYEPDELIGENGFEYIHPADREDAMAAIEAAVTDPDRRPGLEIRFEHADGSWMILEAHARNLLDDDRIGGIVAYTRDVTERRKRERRVERQREQLAALNNLHSVVRDVNEALVRQSTRGEIERTVCERLAESDSYLFAWIGTVDRESRTVTIRTEIGVENYLDDVDITVDDSETGQGPTGRAIRTMEMQVARNVPEDPDYEPWQEHAREHGFRSSAAIPITHQDTLYGVLNVYSERPFAFDGDERAVIGQLGEVIGHAIGAIDRKRALIGDELVEVELQFPGVLDALDVSAPSGVAVTFDRIVPIEGDDQLAYGTVGDGGAEVLDEFCRQLDDFETVTYPAEDDWFELRLTGPPAVRTVAAHGGRIMSAVIEDGDYRMTAQLPQDAEVRRVVAAVREHYPDIEVIAQRRRNATDRQSVRVHRALAEDLTERQRTTLEAAHFAGFFEWPRTNTGEEIAESLGIAPATFHQHVRAAERKLFAALFDDTRE